MEGSGLFASFGWAGVAAILIAALSLIAIAYVLSARALSERRPRFAGDAGESAGAEPPPVQERSSHRVSLIDFVARAGKKGWDVSGQNVQIMDLLRGLREAALAGQIRMWGRPVRSAPDAVVRTELHRQIPPDHWKDFEVDVGTVASRDDNFDTRSCDLRRSDRHSGGFLDIYLDRQAALDWLDGEAETFRRPMRLGEG
jgi:hypothetical protein